MRALTICQPFAHLIVTPQDELPDCAVRKRVENRTWSTLYRGELLIHAGKSLQWLRPGNRESFPEMAFGAIVGVAKLIDCIAAPPGLGGRPQISADDAERYPWLRSHFHTEGPWCWILQDAQRFESPITYRGAQGLFEIPDATVAREMMNLGRWLANRYEVIP